MWFLAEGKGKSGKEKEKEANNDNRETKEIGDENGEIAAGEGIIQRRAGFGEELTEGGKDNEKISKETD